MKYKSSIFVLFCLIIIFLFAKFTNAQNSHNNFNSGIPNQLVIDISKDKWDKADFIGKIVIPIAVTFIIVLWGHRLRKRIDETMINNNAIQTIAASIPYLISNDDKQKKLALEIIKNLEETPLSKGITQILKHIIEPIEASLPPAEQSLYGWIRESLIVVRSINDETEMTGFTNNQYLIFYYENLSSVSFYYQGAYEEIDPNKLALYESHKLALYRLSQEYGKSVDNDYIKNGKHTLIGYKYRQDSMKLDVVKDVDVIGITDDIASTDKDFRSELAGWVAINPGKKSIAGIVSGVPGNDNKLRIIPWEKIKEFILTQTANGNF